MRKKIIRLTESDLHSIIMETVKQMMNEDGEGAAIGGTSSFSITPQNNAAGDATFGSGFPMQRKKIYSPKDKSSSKPNTVDMSDATARHNGKGGSISIPKHKA